MMRGYITTLTPDFPSDGPPTLGVRVVDAIDQAQGLQAAPDKVTYPKVRDFEIAQQIARRHGVDAPRSTETEPEPRARRPAQHRRRAVPQGAGPADRLRRLHADRPEDQARTCCTSCSPADGRGPEPIRTYVLSWGTPAQHRRAAQPDRVQADDHRRRPGEVGDRPRLGRREPSRRSSRPRRRRTPPASAAANGARPGRTPPPSPERRRGPAGSGGRPAGGQRRGGDGPGPGAAGATDRTSSDTAKGKLIGLPDLRLDDNVEIHGVGKRFGGLYHVTKVIHTLNDKGYVTEFEARGS